MRKVKPRTTSSSWQEKCQTPCPSIPRSTGGRLQNQTVRMYVEFVTEPTNTSGVTTMVEKLQLPSPEVGKTCTLVHIDTSLLGESVGPGSQETLRKVWKPDETLIQKLLGSTLVGLGAQQDKNGKCQCPGEGVLAAVFDPLGVLPKTFMKDSTSQPVWLMFNEDGSISFQ